MRKTRPVALGVCATLVLSLLVTPLYAGAPKAADAATAADIWRARVGGSGVNGMATVQADASGSGSILLQLLRLRASSTLAVTLHKGTCASVGAVLLKLPSIRTSSTGAGIRTTRLTTTQVRMIKATVKGTGKLAVRVGVGTSTTCGVFAPVVVQLGYLTRQGSELFLAGKPFHELSFDKSDLLADFSPTLGRDWGIDVQKSVPQAEEALRTLGEKGFRVVRVTTSPSYSGWFDDVFFDADPARQAQKRREFFAAFDQMLDACDRHGIRIVASLLWDIENLGDLGHRSLHEGLTDPASPGRVRFDQYARAVVSRYRDRPTIAMWELGNEFNLVADLQYTNAPFGGGPEGDVHHPGPLVRDARDNFTSDELASFVREFATLIRSIDARHLITTGHSSPRPATMHLLRAVRAGQPVDWTFDSAEELTAYLRLTHPDPIDVISIHYSDDSMVSLGGSLGTPDNLRFFATAATEIGKPLFVGEIGPYSKFAGYNTVAALDELRATLPVLEELKLPLVMYWAFAPDLSLRQRDFQLLALRYGKTDQALGLIEAASAEIRR